MSVATSSSRRSPTCRANRYRGSSCRSVSPQTWAGLTTPGLAPSTGSGIPASWGRPRSRFSAMVQGRLPSAPGWTTTAMMSGMTASPVPRRPRRGRSPGRTSPSPTTMSSLSDTSVPTSSITTRPATPTACCGASSQASTRRAPWSICSTWTTVAMRLTWTWRFHRRARASIGWRPTPTPVVADRRTWSPARPKFAFGPLRSIPSPSVGRCECW